MFCLCYNTKTWKRVYKVKWNNILQDNIFLAERMCNLEAPTLVLNGMVTRGELPHFCMSHIPHLWSGKNKIFLWSCAENLGENICLKFLWGLRRTGHIWIPPPYYFIYSLHRGSLRTVLKNTSDNIGRFPFIVKILMGPSLPTSY